MTLYNPLEHSVVQAMNGDRMGRYEATDFHEALLFAIAREVARVHSNVYHESWDRWGDDPKIPSLHWRHYQYDCECPDGSGWGPEQHLPDCSSSTPHFQFEDVEIDWYKNPGRGMSVNKDWPAEQWVAWFDRCLAKVREFDVDLPKKTNAL